MAVVVNPGLDRSVVCGIGAYIPHRYHFVNEKKTWSEAQTYCRVKYTDLATINNMVEMKKLNHTLIKENAKKAWIGLQREGPGKWLWSLADQTFYRDGDNYTNWASGEPNYAHGNQYCVEMYNGSGLWNDESCEISKSFVCYEGKNINTNRYKMINEQKSWRDAQIYCREKYTDLVNARNKTENEEIKSMINITFNWGVWIGLFYDTWKWTDQSKSSFRYWSSDKHSGGLNCTAVSESEQRYWSDENCAEKLPFICHENKLILIKENLTWKEALRYCRNHHYDLVSVRTEEMQLWVKEVARNASTEHMWLGLRHTCALGFWYWVNGEMICYRDWAPGNGTGFQDCSHEERTGAVQSGGEQKWISLPQSKKLNFICSTYEDMGHKWGFVILFFSVVCDLMAYIPHCYHFVNENKTCSEAQIYCREKYTDLATINNMRDMKNLNHTLMKENEKKAWIGLQREGPGKWQWSLADQTFYRDGDTYTNWDSRQPDNYEGKEYCVEFYKNSKSWNDNKCETSNPFVCYEERNTNTNKYVLINERKSWYDAQIYCREKHTDLVSVRNQTENEEIWRVITSSILTDSRVWIGLFYDSWKWSDQSNSSFRYWSSDKHSGGLNCTAVSESEQRYWSDVNCAEKLPFICHENKLILINETQTWKEALRYCRNRHHDLVTVRTEEMQLWVKEVAQNASTEHVWLGLRHTCALGFWYWVNGEMICYRDWAPGNGTGFQDCSHEERSGAVQSGGEQKWISLPQSKKLNFICSTYEDQ
ncbi:hypothetical protein QTP70_008668 [Hemibagrus guttatus]|uniref:C-type lectin domain-containing protein n=1 Tax=Hemibagrus guttatus TaxID=175788 RepID=A0AAE0Q015_9TELE|nr:hypothetical protein QTP70_008668 [Hemibagrus guttatus]